MIKKITLSMTTLLILGIVMIYSSSSVLATFKHDNQFYYLERQLIFLGLGLIVFSLFYRLNLKWIKDKILYLLIGSFSLLVIVLIPGIGLLRGGSRSWIGIGAFSIQPSEIIKIVLILYYAELLSDNFKKTDQFFYLLKSLIPLFIALGLIMLEPDFGSAFVIFLSIAVMYLMSNVKMKWISYSGFLSVFLGCILIMSASYRLARIKSYIDPYEDPLGSGFQIIQSFYAYIPNSFFGRGLFNSIQKYFYLPEPQTDFIFAIIVEELGCVGIILVFYSFYTLLTSTIKIAFQEEDKYHKYLLIGLIGSLFFQVFINLGVVVGLIPVTGVTLPFLSYGGSSLLITLAMMGIIFNIGSKNKLLNIKSEKRGGL